MTTAQFNKLCRDNNPTKIVVDEYGDGHTIYFDNGDIISVKTHYWPDEGEMDLEYYTSAELAEKYKNSISLYSPEGQEYIMVSMEKMIEKYKPGGFYETALTMFANEQEQTA